MSSPQVTSHRGGKPRCKEKQPPASNHILLGGSVVFGKLLQGFFKCMCSVARLCPSLFYLVDCSPPGFSAHGRFSGKNTGMGCLLFLQGIFPTQELDPYLLLSPTLACRFFTTEPPGKRDSSDAFWQFGESLDE